jgi:hypothetical protein
VTDLYLLAGIGAGSRGSSSFSKSRGSSITISLEIEVVWSREDGIFFKFTVIELEKIHLLFSTSHHCKEIENYSYTAN